MTNSLGRYDTQLLVLGVDLYLERFGHLLLDQLWLRRLSQLSYVFDVGIQLNELLLHPNWSRFVEIQLILGRASVARFGCEHVELLRTQDFHSLID